MGRPFRHLWFVALYGVLFAAPVTASAASCTMPERIHLRALSFSYDDALDPIAKRIASEGFEAVGATLPSNYIADVGWFTPDQLDGTRYAPAAKLQAGGTARMNPAIAPGFVHVDERIPAMSCDRAIAIHPDSAEPRLARANLEAQRGMYAAAKNDYSVAALSVDRTFAQPAQYALAYIYYIERDYNKALTHVNVAVESNSGDAYTLKALIEEAMGDDDLATADAARGYGQYHGNEQDPSLATYALAQAYSDLGYFAASNAQLNTILGPRQRYANAFILRAFNEFSTGDSRDARQDLTSALGVNPRLENPYVGLAILDYSLGDATSARTYAQRAFSLFPHSLYAKLWILVTSGRAPEHPSGLKPCEPGFYAGIYDLQHGHKQDGNVLLRTAAKTCPYREYERAAALELLKH
jgi:tetratricopeptide (TPR) repeat protein